MVMLRTLRSSETHACVATRIHQSNCQERIRVEWNDKHDDRLQGSKLDLTLWPDVRAAGQRDMIQAYADMIGTSHSAWCRNDRIVSAIRLMCCVYSRWFS